MLCRGSGASPTSVLTSRGVSSRGNHEVQGVPKDPQKLQLTRGSTLAVAKDGRSGILEPGTEAYYQWFLRRSIKHGEPRPNNWIYDQSVKDRSTSVMRGHRGGLLRVFDDSHTDLELAGKCLKAFVVYAHSSSQGSRDAVRKYMLRASPGIKVLTWLSSNDSKIPDPGRSRTNPAVRRFLEAFAHCLVGEKELARLWEWLDPATTSNCVFDVPKGGSPLWKAGLLQAVVGSTMFWAETGKQLQSGLRVCLAAIEANAGAPKRGDDSRRVRCDVAYSWLHKMLMRRGAHSIDSSDFEKFIAYGRFFLEGHLLAFDQAQLKLVHPTMPTPEPFLQCARSWKDLTCEHYFRRAFLNPSVSSAAYAVFWPTLKAAQQFERRGQLERAKELIDIVRVYLPA